MVYRVEYSDDSGDRCVFAFGSKTLIRRLKLLKDFVISDIRKYYKNGVSDSVIDKYRKFIQFRKEV